MKLITFAGYYLGFFKLRSLVIRAYREEVMRVRRSWWLAENRLQMQAEMKEFNERVVVKP